jgi:hypothetical protein
LATGLKKRVRINGESKPSQKLLHKLSKTTGPHRRGTKDTSGAPKIQSADRSRLKLHKSGSTNSIVGIRSEKNFPSPDQRVTALGTDVSSPSEEKDQFSNNR